LYRTKPEQQTLKAKRAVILEENHRPLWNSLALEKLRQAELTPTHHRLDVLDDAEPSWSYRPDTVK
jgi:hypothetical protein